MQTVTHQAHSLSQLGRRSSATKSSKRQTVLRGVKTYCPWYYIIISDACEWEREALLQDVGAASMSAGGQGGGGGGDSSGSVTVPLAAAPPPAQ